MRVQQIVILIFAISLADKFSLIGSIFLSCFLQEVVVKNDEKAHAPDEKAKLIHANSSTSKRDAYKANLVS